MRILEIETTPLHAIAWSFPGPAGGPAHGALPVLRGWVDRLPGGLAALICASDLQGVEPAPGESRQIGVRVAEELALLAELGELPAGAATGVLLAGDLYGDPESKRRGANGDAAPVWRAFGEHFRWVAGVAGNHDHVEALLADPPPNGHYLDGAARELDGLRVAGLGGIVGNSKKLHRRPPPAYGAGIRALLAAAPDILVLHESPAAHGREQTGSFVARDALAGQSRLVVVSGHHHWAAPLAIMPEGYQILNVDARAVVLLPAGERRDG
ncbi:MAG TPA: metallophosphoesterase [Herpetosiphonaceae bacterium]